MIDAATAAAHLAEVNAVPSIANMARVARLLGPHRKELAVLSRRIGCISSFTFEPLRAALELQALRAGADVETYVAPYGQFDRELIDPVSGLAAYQADIVLVAIRLQDVCPAIYESFNSLSAESARGLVDSWMERFSTAIAAFRQRSSAYILVQDYDLPIAPALGIAEQPANGQIALIALANAELRKLAAAHSNVYVMNYDALVARHGREGWTDRRMALYARIPIAPAHYWNVAGFYVRHMRPLLGLSKKVLVLDADNTLWGGVLGDLGPGEIALGPDYPGSAFVALQRRVLDLYHRGVVLAIASKNEPGSVEAVLEKHPEMVLRPSHIASLRVNWQPKPQNIREIAQELNLGLDSFVFIDDHPVECELMRSTLPQVMTICLPNEPADYARVIESLDCFDQWTISSEDRARGQLYGAEAERRRLQAKVVDMPTFYRQLQMKLTIGVDQPSQIARAAQMTGRTNQFNMNTLRCSEDDIRRFMNADDHHVITLALEDRFGDNGIVGLAVVRRAGEEWILHMYLMSCRVLGRTVEQAFIKWIGSRAQSAGARRVVGLYAPTAKNKPFSGYYESCGFSRASSSENPQSWTLDLSAADLKMPDWFELVTSPVPEAAA